MRLGVEFFLILSFFFVSISCSSSVIFLSFYFHFSSLGGLGIGADCGVPAFPPSQDLPACHGGAGVSHWRGSGAARDAARGRIFSDVFLLFLVNFMFLISHIFVLLLSLLLQYQVAGRLRTPGQLPVDEDPSTRGFALARVRRRARCGVGLIFFRVFPSLSCQFHAPHLSYFRLFTFTSPSISGGWASANDWTTVRRRGLHHAQLGSFKSHPLLRWHDLNINSRDACRTRTL